MIFEKKTLQKKTTGLKSMPVVSISVLAVLPGNRHTPTRNHCTAAIGLAEDARVGEDSYIAHHTKPFSKIEQVQFSTSF